MKQKQLTIIGIVAMLVCVGLSGCNSTTDNTSTNRQVVDKEKFIGTWSGHSESECCGSQNKTIIFNSSGTVEWGDPLPYTYSVEGDTLYIGYGELSTQEDAYSYSFKNNYTTLTLSLLTPNSENNSGLTIYLNKQ